MQEKLENDCGKLKNENNFRQLFFFMFFDFLIKFIQKNWAKSRWTEQLSGPFIAD